MGSSSRQGGPAATTIRGGHGLGRAEGRGSVTPQAHIRHDIAVGRTGRARYSNCAFKGTSSMRQRHLGKALPPLHTLPCPANNRNAAKNECPAMMRSGRRETPRMRWQNSTTAKMARPPGPGKPGTVMDSRRVMPSKPPPPPPPLAPYQKKNPRGKNAITAPRVDGVAPQPDNVDVFDGPTAAPVLNSSVRLAQR